MKTLRQMMDLIENFQQVPEGSEQKKPLKTHKSGCGYNHGHDCDCSGTLTHASNCHYNYGHDCDCGLDELKHQQQNKQQGVAEGLNEMDKSQTPPGRDGDIDWTKKQIHLGPEHTMKAKDVAKHALKALDKTMKKSHADTPKKKGVAEHQMEESTPDALAKIDNLFRK